MRHFFAISAEFGSEDLAESFEKEMAKQQRYAKTFQIFHRNTCDVCDGSGEVCAKGLCMDCAKCGGGYRP